MAEFITLTYRALADRLGVSLPAAKARVRRAKWSVSLGNDGVAIVRVPEDDLRDAERGTEGDTTPLRKSESARTQPDIAQTVSDAGQVMSDVFRLFENERERSIALEAEVRDLSVRLARSEALLEAEKARAERAEMAGRSHHEPSPKPTTEPATKPDASKQTRSLFHRFLRKVT